MEKTVFEQIARQYADMLYKIAFNYLKNKEDSEDAVQNTLIRLYRYHGSFQSEEHTKAWLIRVTINESKRICARNKTHTTENLELIADKLYADAIESKELFMELMRLKPLYSTVLYLYYYEGYRSSEIAAMLKKSDANIRAILSRARKQLKTQLEVEPDEQSS